MRRKLLLSGGAAKGAVQLYPAIELLKLYQYEEIEGVSIGAVNGAKLAQGESDELIRIWETVNSRSSFMTFKWWWPFKGIYNLKPLRRLLEQHLSLERLQVPFRAGVVSLNNGDYYSLSTKDMVTDKEYHDAVQASATVIGVMEPIEMALPDGIHMAADGGFRNIVPVPLVPEPDITHVDVILCSPIERIYNFTQVNDIGEHIMRVLDIMQEEILIRDLGEIKVGYPNAEITVYSPQRDPLPSFKADRATIEYRYNLGKEAWAHPLLLT